VNGLENNIATMGILSQLLKLFFIQEELVCNALGIQPKADFAHKVPSEQQLDEFELYIKEKNDEKVSTLWQSMHNIGCYDH
jgi:hypothetical protein